MTEAVAATAGGLLKAAREKQGIHIAALAASIKVTPRKLEALEHDRYDELPDMTFVRALAKTVCRTLKIEPEPVLALLPHQADSGTALAQVSTGLNQPFRERPARGDPPEWAVLQKPVLWGAGAVLLAALVVYLLPERALEGLAGGAGGSTTESAGDVAGSVGSGASGVVTEVIEAASAAIDTVHSVPSVPEPAASALTAPSAATVTSAAAPAEAAAAASAAASAPAAAPAATAATAGAAGALVLRATAESWVEVRDRSGRVLLSRTLQSGETVGVDGEIPLRATIGNAAGTQVTFRGQPVDTSATRDNVARLELK